MPIGFAIVLTFIWACARYRMRSASLNLDFQEFAEAAQFLGFLYTATPGLLAAGIAFAIREFRDRRSPDVSAPRAKLRAPLRIHQNMAIARRLGHNKGGLK